MDETGRNSPCPCGSGKKFKKCCYKVSSVKKINATVLSTNNEQSSHFINQLDRTASIFKTQIETPEEKKEEPEKITDL